MSIKTAAMLTILVLLAACHRGANKADIVQAANIPAGFDVTIIAAKDNQFDLDGAPLTSADLQSAFRYRQEEKLPMSTVLMKRGEKEKIKKEHIIALAGLAYQMKFKAYIDIDGVISEILAQSKKADSEPAAATPSKDH